jgi:broad specificity phosphatase PhoE
MSSRVLGPVPARVRAGIRPAVAARVLDDASGAASPGRMRALYFVTHPDVVADPAVPVPRWPLSPRGLERIARLLDKPWVAGVTSIYCSSEQKAIDGARVLGARLGLRPVLREELGERDRSSTGYLAEDEFRAAVARSFAEPEASVGGSEPSAAAQRRIVAAIDEIRRADPGPGAIAVVSHSGVGALLLCHAAGRPIAIDAQQPGRTGGCWLAIDVASGRLIEGWHAID